VSPLFVDVHLFSLPSQQAKCSEAASATVKEGERSMLTIEPLSLTPASLLFGTVHLNITFSYPQAA
jgi:hypothetical protein